MLFSLLNKLSDPNHHFTPDELEGYKNYAKHLKTCQNLTRERAALFSEYVNEIDMATHADQYLESCIKSGNLDGVKKAVRALLMLDAETKSSIAQKIKKSWFADACISGQLEIAQIFLYNIAGDDEKKRKEIISEQLSRNDSSLFWDVVHKADELSQGNSGEVAAWLMQEAKQAIPSLAKNIRQELDKICLAKDKGSTPHDIRTLKFAKYFFSPLEIVDAYNFRLNRNISTTDEIEIQQDKAAWKKIARIEPPHNKLAEKPPKFFKKKLYDELLPITRLTSEIEGNQLAEIHAYKLAVLFSNAKEAGRYLDKYANLANVKQPVHDALLFEFPTQGQWTATKWKDAILRDGPAFGKFLPRAPEIEACLARHNRKFPDSLSGMRDILSLLSYKRAAENLDFAIIAKRANISEKTFNRILDLIARGLKTKDNIPDIVIDGKDIGHPSFYMEKLKPNDPIGFILGGLTNCCQSIGEDGAVCAWHGMTSQNGGFYVWKHREKGGDKIVAQSHVWISQNNSLVFDSFERLGPEYDKLVAPFMEQFGYELKNKHQVFVGMGGNTPELEYSVIKEPYVEKPKDFKGYGDSMIQYSIPPVNHKSKEKTQVERITARRNEPPAAGIA